MPQSPARPPVPTRAATLGGRRLARWWTLLPLAVVALQVALIAMPLARGRLYNGFDLREQFLPWRVFYKVALESGGIGAWNPFLARGYDHLGEGQAGVLHPVHWLVYRTLPLDLAVSLELIGHFAFAAMGMWLWLHRGRRQPALAAALGAGAFALSVYMHAHFIHVNMLWVYAHLPWMLWAVDGCFGVRRWRAAAGVGLCMASMLLLGHPQMVFLNGLAVGVLVGWRGLRTRGRATWRRGLAVALAGVVAGCLIGALQVLPTAALAAQSPRSREALEPWARDNFALHPLAALTQVAPAFFAERIVPTPVRNTATAAPVHLLLYEEWSCYLGLGLLQLCFAGVMLYGPTLWRRRRAPVLLFGGAVAVAGLLSLGSAGLHLIDLQAFIPFVKSFRVPSRYISLLIVGLAVGGASTLTALLRRPPPVVATWQWRCLTIPAALALGALLANRAMVMASWVPNAGGTLHQPTLELAPLLAAPAMAILGLALLIGRLRGAGAWTLALIAVLCVGDLAMANLEIVRGVLVPAPTRPLSDLDRMANAVRATAANPSSEPYRHLANNNQAAWDGHYLANGYLGLPPPEPLVLDIDGDPALLVTHLRLASVQTIHGANSLIVLPGPLPRVRLVSTVRASLTPLREACIPGFDLANTALCRPGEAPLLDGLPIDPATEHATAVADRFDALEIDVQAAAPRMLVLSDRPWPGWSATLDGQATPLTTLFDGTIRGVAVPPGSHRVVLLYRNPALPLGQWLAVAGSLFLLAFWLLDRRQCRAYDLRPDRRDSLLQ